MADRLEHTITELKGLTSHILDLKRICFDNFGDTTEGYQAHCDVSDMEASCLSAIKQLEALRPNTGGGE